MCYSLRPDVDECCLLVAVANCFVLGVCCCSLAAAGVCCLLFAVPYAWFVIVCRFCVLSVAAVVVCLLFVECALVCWRLVIVGFVGVY